MTRDAHRASPAIALLVALGLLASGCGAILNDRYDPLAVTSEPEGAQVRVNGVPMGHTPVVLQLDSRMNHTVVVNLDGYDETGAIVTSGLGAGWLVLDIFLTGLIGIVVDAVTGAWNELDADGLHFDLGRQGQWQPETGRPVAIERLELTH